MHFIHFQIPCTIMTTEQIGSILHFHRKKAGLSRKRLSELSGVGTTTIYDIERGKPGVELIGVLTLLATLNISLLLESQFMKECAEENPI